MRVLQLKLRRFTSRQLALQLLSAQGLDKKKDLSKVVLRQSVMNWVGALDDLGGGMKTCQRGRGRICSVRARLTTRSLSAWLVRTMHRACFSKRTGHGS